MTRRRPRGASTTSTGASTSAEPDDEISELAATLDALLDRVAASLRHEQRFSAELSHELRTPLARIIAEAELALRRERAPEELPRGARAVPAAPSR